MAGDPFADPFAPPRRPNPFAGFRPLTVTEQVMLARAPRRRPPVPLMVRTSPITYDLTGKDQQKSELRLAHYQPGDVIRTDGADVRLQADGTPRVMLQERYRNGRSAGVQGPVIVPTAPRGANVDANMGEAERHPPWWLVERVPSGKAWDYKTKSSRNEAFGNFNFGAVSRAAGVPDPFMLRGAGVAQILDGHWKPSYGEPLLGVGSYGDDPVDQFWIVQGSRYAQRK